MKIKTTLFILPIVAVASAISVNADTLYWVDATSYFNAPPNGKVTVGTETKSIQNIGRNFNSNTQSTYSTNYNWATGYTVKEVVVDKEVDSVVTQTTYKVPNYTFAETPTAPNENTDVYFKFSEFSAGNSTDGYRYQVAGSPTLSANMTVKSITIEGANDNWLMFKTSGYDLTITGDLTYKSSNAVSWIGESSKTTLTVGGTVNINSGSTSIWNAFRLGSTPVKAISLGGIKYTVGGRLELATAGTGGTFANAQSNVTGLTDFGGNAARLDLGCSAQSSEQFFAFNGISGTNSSAIITTHAENSSTGIISTLVFTNATSASFAGKVSNSLIANDSGADKRVLDNTVSVVMNGDGTQILSGANDFKGYVQIEKGKLLLKTDSAASHGKLTLNGGVFGAVSSAKFSSAEWNGGKLVVFNTSDSIANLTPEIITISGSFAKKGTGKIAFDFNDVDTLDLLDNGKFYDLIVAGSLEGFLADAESDFVGVNLTGANAIFKWVNDTVAGTSTLKVGFSSVPEPATVAAIFGAVALMFAAYLRRRK